MAAKIKKNKLEIEYTYDFELLGVRTSLKGYKLAWEINKILRMNLIKHENLVIDYKKGSSGSYDRYIHRAASHRLSRAASGSEISAALAWRW